MNRLEYLDFDLLFEKSEDAYKARVLNSPCGQALTEFTLPFNSLQIENLLLRVGRTRRGVRRLESPEMEACRNFGAKLFSSVFDNEVLGCLRSSLSEGYRRGLGLRLRLRFSATPELVDLPWEFLYDSARNQFLVLSVETPLVRYLELPQDVQPLPVKPPLKILVMIASPQDYPPLDVEREWAKLNEALGDLEKRGLVSLTRLETATLASLQRQLRRGQYHIFHFIGHGAFNNQAQDGVLLTEDEAGRGRPVSGYDLGTLLHDHRSLRLAVLNACEGARSSLTDPFAGAAQSLVQQGIPAVIAMQFEITDPAAITLAHEFYGALADGYTVDAALAEARKAIFAQGNDVEWATPVLYLRAPTGAVFQIESVAANGTGTFTRPLTGPIPAITAKTDQLSDELKNMVERLYTEGLGAYWLDEWQKACESFEAVLKLQPDHPEAAARLEAAQRYLRLERLSQQAQAAEEAGKWVEAVPLLGKLAEEAPAYQNSANRLEVAKKQKQLQDLYEEARQLSQAAKWQAVINVFVQVTSLDPSAADPEGLLPKARLELAAQQRLAGLESSYTQAVREIDAGHWENAARLLREVQAKEPGYRQVERLLGRVEVEIARQSRPETPSQDTPTPAPEPTRQAEPLPAREPPVAEKPARTPQPTQTEPLGQEIRETVPLATTIVEEATSSTPAAGLAWQPRPLPGAVKPALLLGFGWFLSFFVAVLLINSEPGHSLVDSVHSATQGALNWDHIFFALGGLFVGIFCGPVLGISLSVNRVQLSSGRFVALIIGWIVAFLFPFIYAWSNLDLSRSILANFLAGGIGGWVTGMVLRKAAPNFDRRAFALTILGWAAALASGQWFINSFYYNLLSNYSSSIFSTAFYISLGGGLTAFIGGLATYYALRARQARPETSSTGAPTSVPENIRKVEPLLVRGTALDSVPDRPPESNQAQPAGQVLSEGDPAGVQAAALPSIFVWRAEIFKELAIPALILGLGWFISGLFSILFADSETGYNLVVFFKDVSSGTIGEELIYYFLILMSFGTLGSIFLGIWLLSNRVPLSRRRFIALIAGWVVAFFIPFIYGWINSEQAQSLLIWFLVGAIGGWITGLVLGRAGLSLDRQALIQVILSWAIGLGIGNWLVETIYTDFISNFWSSTFATAFFTGLGFWLAAFIGGLVTLIILKKQAPVLVRP